MRLELFKPRNKILAEYMEGYYFLVKDDGSAPVEYFTFPNNYSIITICENVELDFEDHSIVARGSNNGEFISELICHYRKPIKVSLQGSMNEITFYFKPLGLNAFLDHPLKEYTSEFFKGFFPYDDYREFMLEILKKNDFEQRIEMIENYWMSKFRGFEHSFLNNLIDQMLSDPEESLNNFAIKYKTSRQTINTLFDHHLCKSPSDFRKIQRFRETLIKNIDRNTSLTELSYDNLFYDQSHLIKDFKSLTGFTPKKFFKNISFYQEGKVNWFFL
ncbi:helix-turn-helix domain-containing protein [Chryseobacterium sp. S-02]|uniref:helix-turn-helix domain-containing protein n=1 Tax=Chryseobacterium sp. S-02 TaxID=3404064 RepID=UPI003CE6ED5F